MYKIILYSFLFLIFCVEGAAQVLSGYVYNDENDPIPLVNIYVRQLETGTATDLEGKYFLNLVAGEYDLVFSAIGYETKNLNLIVEDDDLIKDVQLVASDLELNEIVVKAGRRDPAYEIIQKAVDHRKKFLSQIESYKCEVYVKATEVSEEEEQKKREKEEKKKKAKRKKEKDEAALEKDPFEEAERLKEEREAELSKLNMVEMQVTLNYEAPNNYKEERTAYKLYGKKHGLMVPQFSETDFNFYENLVTLEDISEVPIISPISRTAILSYKYKLEEIMEEAEQTVYKIKVIPRKKGNSTCKGYIYINEGIWNINRFDFSFYKGGLKFHDEFQLKQDYTQIEDSIWVPARQELVYATKVSKKNFKGNTLLYYTDYEKDFEFPEKFFGNEISLTTQEAYDKDSTFWSNKRPEPLTQEEQISVAFRDSVEAVHNSKEYKDSVEADYNKVTPLELLWDGVGFRKHEKKQQIFIGPLPSLVSFDIVGGFRFGPFVSYFRRWENGKTLRAFGNMNVGFKNKDLQGTFVFRRRYNPHKLADVYGQIQRSFESINPDDAIVNLANPANYILLDNLEFGHKFEIINGLYLNTKFNFQDRQSIENYDYFELFDFEENTPLSFENYEALITNIQLSYTPKQKFMTEPSRKVVLGSKFPTFTARYKRGWNKVLTSDVDFDYLEFEVKQDVILGVFGNSKYSIKTGKFVNTNELKFIDRKRFRPSDRYFFSNPLASFQVLYYDGAFLSTDDFFVEFHHIHHFNGALVNNIPLIKMLRLRAVIGGGALWMQQNDFRQGELFAGVERVFKLGVRRRLRLGVYGVLGESNFAPTQTNIKFSIDVIDTWKRDWSF